MKEITVVATWLSNVAKDESYAAHYGQVRGNVLHQTLHRLKAHEMQITVMCCVRV